jgi:hypothetical protein
MSCSRSIYSRAAVTMAQEATGKTVQALVLCISVIKVTNLLPVQLEKHSTTLGASVLKKISEILLTYDSRWQTPSATFPA